PARELCDEVVAGREVTVDPAHRHAGAPGDREVRQIERAVLAELRDDCVDDHVPCGLVQPRAQRRWCSSRHRDMIIADLSRTVTRAVRSLVPMGLARGSCRNVADLDGVGARLLLDSRSTAETSLPG